MDTRVSACVVPVDVVAGLTLTAVAIPEVVGYTSIAGTPIATGLYTVIFPTMVFALLGSSKLLVVGADSATAAILAAGLAGLGVAGLAPNTAEWLACNFGTHIAHASMTRSLIVTSSSRPSRATTQLNRRSDVPGSR
jgi:MFS superfamily sulfate permease-like transporter